MADVWFFVFRTYLITMMTLGMMASLTEFRFGPRKLLCMLAVYSLWVVASSAALLWLGGELLLLRLFFLTVSIPGVLLTYFAANDSPTQAIFNYITQILISLLGVSMIRWLTDTYHLAKLPSLLLTCLFYLVVIYLEWRFLRQPMRMLIRVIPTSWGVLSLIPSAFCLQMIFMASWPVNYIENEQQRMYLYSGILPLAVIYIAVFKSLVGQYRIQLERQSTALLKVQIAALKDVLQKDKEMEESIQIQRHDLRHQLQTVTELVMRGEKESTLNFLDAAQKRLDEKKQLHWCNPPVLNAVFSAYFDQANRQDIPVDAKLSLPNTLPVDESELAIVLANGLENAIHANMELPPDQREIRCKMVGTPSVMLEISNPCHKKVVFDNQGLPLAQQEGHGLGVQSISIFCRKHGAAYQFDLTDGWFRLRLVL